MKTEEKRGRVYSFSYRLPRFNVDFRFWLHVEQEGGEVLNARCLDISEEGLAAELSASLSIGTAVILSLPLPGPANTLLVRANVIHAKEKNHGFRFMFLSQGERDKVYSYLEQLRLRTPQPK
jgi:hypothetical protein